MSPDTLQLSWRTRLWRWVAAGAAALAAVVSGCGGGVGVGGTGAYASGPVTGFGSIFVNGIEFEDRNAQVEDESGASRSRDALRLGMLVEVESGPIGGNSSAPTATATRIRFASELVGPVQNVDLAGSSLTVLGQTVLVASGRTAFDASYAEGLASVALGSNVEVYGFYGLNGRLIATRIEPRGGTLAAFKLRGAVSGLDLGAHTFQLGALTLDYDGLAPPTGLRDGLIVRVTVATTAVSGRWKVLTFEDGVRRLPDRGDARLRGTITAFSTTRSFSINGQPVDASTATLENEAGIALGARVEAEGAASGGVLRATRVKVDDGGAQGGELRGLIEASFPLLQTFVLRGVRVTYRSGTEFQDGSAADLSVGREVEARGVLSGDGTRLLATRIRIR